MKKEYKINLNEDEYIIEIEKKDLEYIDGYAAFACYINDEVAVSAVLDENMETVLPPTLSFTEDLENYISVFKGHKAIYPFDGLYYVIDIPTADFKKNDIGNKPVNYKKVFNYYEVIDEERVIVERQERYRLYNIVEDEYLSDKFDSIHMENDIVLACLLFGYANNQALYTTLTMDKNGKIRNKFYIDDIECKAYDKEIFKVDNLKDFSLKTFVDIHGEQEKCKILN